MKKKKLLSQLKTILHPKRVLCLAMVGLLCVGSVQSLHVRASSEYDDSAADDYAVEYSDDYTDSTYYDDSDSGGYVETYQDYSGGNDPYVYSINCDQDVVSFGKITKGSDRIYQPFVLSNTGSTPVDLVWYMTGNENGPFQVDQPSNLHLESGASCTFYVSVDTSKAAGTYNAAVRASDNLDPGGNYGVVVPLSVTIEEKVPTVTSVTVLPETATMAKGSSMSFSSNVKGNNNPNLDVTWSVSNNQSSGTYIDSTGKLVVDAKEGAGSLVVTATSVQNPDVADCAYVTLKAGNHTVSVQADPSSGGAVGGGGAVADGTGCEIYATPNNGYQFVGWKYKNQVISTNSRYTIPSVTEDMNVTAAFKQVDCYVTIKKNHDNAGSITSSQNVGYGGAITLEANAGNGYRFDCWKEGDNVISKDAKHTVSNITGNREFTAYFSRTQYKVSVSVTPQDTGYTAGGATYNAGDNVTLTATAYSGYHFEKWTSGDKVLGTDSTLVIKNLQVDANIVANFAKDTAKTYTITAACANAGGTISPAGTSKVSEGSNAIYSIVPDKGYMVSNVVVDNKSIGAVYSYTFTSIKGNHAIAVAFQPVPAASSAASTGSTSDKKKADAASTASTGKSESAGTSSSAASTGSSSSKQKTDAAGTASAGKSESAGASSSAASVKQSESAASEGSSEEQTSESVLPLDEDGNYDPHYDDDVLTDPDTLEGYNEQTGVFQILNITPSDARTAIESGEDAQLLQLAYNQDYIMVNIHNDYSSDDTTTAGSHFGSTADFPNLEYVINGILTEEDKMCAFAGNEVSFNLTLYSTNDYPTDADQQIQESCDKNDLSVGELFEVLLLKTTHGETQTVTEFNTPMRVVMQIPDSIKESGRAYCIVRSHEEENGSLSISFLQDLDEDPDTITFETDRLSSYAIAYQDGGSGIIASGVLKIVVGVVIAVIVITLLLGIVSGVRHGGRAGKDKE